MTLFRKAKDIKATWLISKEKTASNSYIHVYQIDGEYKVIVNKNDLQITRYEIETTRYVFELLRHAKSFAVLLINSDDDWADYHEHRMACMDDDDKRYYAKRPQQLQNLRDWGRAPKWDI